MSGMSGSGPLGADAQMAWLGQPAHAASLPAACDSGPGQCSGSGATRAGADLREALRAEETSVVVEGGSSREGAMVVACGVGFAPVGGGG